MLLNHAHALVSTEDIANESVWRRWEIDVPNGICVLFIAGYIYLTSKWRASALESRQSSWPTKENLEGLQGDNTVALPEFFRGLKLQGPMIAEGYSLCLPTDEPGADLWQTRGQQLTNDKVELESYFPVQLRHLSANVHGDDVRQLYEACGSNDRPAANFKKLDRSLQAFDVVVERSRTNTPGIDSFALARVRDEMGVHNCLIIVQNKAQSVEARNFGKAALNAIVKGALEQRGCLFVTEADKKPSHPLFAKFPVLEKHVVVLAAVHGQCTVTEHDADEILLENEAALTVAYGGADAFGSMLGPSLHKRVAARLAYLSGAAK